MLPRARDGARHEVLDDKRHDRGTWSCQSPPALVGQVLLCYWGLSASCKGAKRNFSFKAQFQDKNFTLKNRNQLLMQTNKQSQANHSTVNPPQKRAARAGHGRVFGKRFRAGAGPRSAGRPSWRRSAAGHFSRGAVTRDASPDAPAARPAWARFPSLRDDVSGATAKSHHRRVSRFFIF